MGLAPVDPARAGILEIGHQHFFGSALPSQTTTLWTHRKPPSKLSAEEYQNFSLSAWRRAKRRIAAGEIKLVIAYADDWAPWNWRSQRGLLSGATPLRLAGLQFLRGLASEVPLVVIDYSDSGAIQPHNQFLLDRARYYFKSQLPADRWLVFHRSGHPSLPATSFRRSKRNRIRLQKIRPLSLGVFDSANLRGFPDAPDKEVDVFASLAVPFSSTVRVEGLRQLKALAAEGVRVDIQDRRLSFEEYLARMSRAWLTWSPEGFGWECHRHYEAPLVGSVAIINQPTIVRYKPFVDGIHCFYYYPDEPDGLARVVKSALADKERLRRIATSTSQHTRAHHTWPERASEILRISLGLEPAPGAFVLD